jgi:hypothetical protein
MDWLQICLRSIDFINIILTTFEPVVVVRCFSGIWHMVCLWCRSWAQLLALYTGRKVRNSVVEIERIFYALRCAPWIASGLMKLNLGKYFSPKILFTTICKEGDNKKELLNIIITG